MKYGYRTRTIATLTIAYSDLQIIIIRLTTIFKKALLFFIKLFLR